ncbi:MAG: sugar phosphate isomerase/epimerase [Planctomycetota bacterium]|nr:MAG: sugar phosphate isomerase/epimerase [Planctomycetota bacterium]
MAKLKIGLQLYTVRDLLAQDFVDTLKKVREIGYTCVELADHGGYPAAVLKKLLEDVGLNPISNHCPIEQMESDINKAVEETLALGTKYLACPYLPGDWRKDEAGWRRCAEVLNRAGKVCKSWGIRLCYHNHSFEFIRIGKRYAFDLLYEETNPAYVQAELDTYWVQHGGEDPVGYINKLSGRCPLIHLKDMSKEADRSFAAVGEGILDFPAIFAAAEAAGSVWGIVEQDTCPADPLDSIATSLANLKKMGYA